MSTSNPKPAALEEFEQLIERSRTTRITVDGIVTVQLLTVREEELRSAAASLVVKVLDELEQSGHGGGNWRRLIAQLRAQYVEYGEASDGKPTT